MTGRDLHPYVRPQNGCARCQWWSHWYGKPWGKCAVNKDKRWYQAPPCPEYEKKPAVQDTIMLYYDLV